MVIYLQNYPFWDIYDIPYKLSLRSVFKIVLFHYPRGIDMLPNKL